MATIHALIGYRHPPSHTCTKSARSGTQKRPQTSPHLTLTHHSSEPQSNITEAMGLCLVFSLVHLWSCALYDATWQSKFPYSSLCFHIYVLLRILQATHIIKCRIAWKQPQLPSQQWLLPSSDPCPNATPCLPSQGLHLSDAVHMSIPKNIIVRSQSHHALHRTLTYKSP